MLAASEVQMRALLLGFCLTASFVQARAEGEAAATERGLAPGAELYLSLGHDALAGDLFGGNSAGEIGLGVNAWFANARHSGWGSYLGIDIAALAQRDAQSNTAFPFKAGDATKIQRDNLSVNICGGMNGPVWGCLGVGYAMYYVRQGDDYNETYGAPVWALTVKVPVGGRWLVGASTDWSKITQKIAGRESGTEFWRTSVTGGYVF